MFKINVICIYIYIYINNRSFIHYNLSFFLIQVNYICRNINPALADFIIKSNHHKFKLSMIKISYKVNCGLKNYLRKIEITQLNIWLIVCNIYIYIYNYP